MKQTIILIFIGLFVFQVGNSQTTEDQKQKLDSYKIKFNQDNERLIKFTRLTSDNTFAELERKISALDKSSKITYTRNKNGKMESLKFSNAQMSCACDKSDVGIVYITIKGTEINSCGAIDFSGIMSLKN